MATEMSPHFHTAVLYVGIRTKQKNLHISAFNLLAHSENGIDD